MKSTIAILIGLVATGCGGKGGAPLSPGPQDEGPSPAVEEFVADGWRAFEAGDFAAALSLFDEAIRLDDENAEAHSGTGWARMRLGDLREAAASFDEAIRLGFDSTDPWAGKAAVHRDLEPVDWQSALDAARDALGRDPRYVFPHDDAFDWEDLRLILAHAAFALADYDLAAAQVDSLGGAAPDPTGADFVENLLSELQRLGQGA